MQIKNDPTDLAGNDNETISVTAVPKNEGDTVAFALNGTKGALPNPYTFKLEKGKSPMVLTLVFTFLGADGAFDIRVTGSAGGSPSLYTYDQFGVDEGSVSYAFDVV
jgi:hypothetical protein